MTTPDPDPTDELAKVNPGRQVLPPTLDERVSAAATRFNTHATGFAGVAAGTTGAVGIVAAVGRLFALLSSPQFLFALIGEHDAHTFGPNTAALAAALFGIIGAVVLLVTPGLVAAYLGRPKNIPQQKGSP